MAADPPPAGVAATHPRARSLPVLVAPTLAGGHRTIALVAKSLYGMPPSTFRNATGIATCVPPIVRLATHVAPTFWPGPTQAVIAAPTVVAVPAIVTGSVAFATTSVPVKVPLSTVGMLDPGWLTCAGNS